MAERRDAEGDGGGAAGGDRRCIATRVPLGRDEGLRFVLDPEGRLVFDAAGRLPGRGFWLSPRRDVLERARLGQAFSKAARRPVAVPEGLAEEVAAALRRRVLAGLGLARRAGLVAAGLEKVRAALIAGRARALLQAEDAALPARRRLAALGRGRRADLRLYGGLSAEDLGRALGRGPTVHLALLEGGATASLLRELDRLAALGAAGAPLWGPEGSEAAEDEMDAARKGGPDEGLGERPLDCDDDG